MFQSLSKKHKEADTRDRTTITIDACVFNDGILGFDVTFVCVLLLITWFCKRLVRSGLHENDLFDISCKWKQLTRHDNAGSIHNNNNSSTTDAESVTTIYKRPLKTIQLAPHGSLNVDFEVALVAFHFVYFSSNVIIMWALHCHKKHILFSRKLHVI